MSTALSVFSSSMGYRRGALVRMLLDGKLINVEIINIISPIYYSLDDCNPVKQGPSLNYTKFHKHYGRNK
jgi:hypothetical protein